MPKNTESKPQRAPIVENAQKEPADSTAEIAASRRTSDAPVEGGEKIELAGSKEAQSEGGALTFDAIVDSVQPTGSGRDTFTLVLRPDENDVKFFRRAAGRIELIDVRDENGKQFQGKARAKVTIEITA